MKSVEIVGLDYSKEMIAIATLQKETENISNLSLVQGDVGELPYADESFDCVLSMNGFQAFPRQRESLCRNLPRVETRQLLLWLLLCQGRTPIRRLPC
ncbi:class I SAM-dependent methyltransferase [Prevotella jejuni]|jgi:methyltransferase, ubiE/COQ5 family|uniref:class I SAM-dependent methyltransferase n=1 Tax=Prevotella TaxID=838 RepID=UPI0028E8C576|nr:class I SAM-dependent methyltransferase [Prevotella jejuni]